jgi:hypothetical protein
MRFGLVDRHQGPDVHRCAELARCLQGLVVENDRLTGGEGLGSLLCRLEEILQGLGPLLPFRERSSVAERYDSFIQAVSV